MNRFPVIALGALMIGAALYLASGASSQTTADQPQVAQALATALHRTPALAPAVTRTPGPTATRSPEWGRSATTDFSLWLPNSYEAMEMPEGVTIERVLRGIPLVGLLVLYAFDAPDPDRYFSSVQVLEVQTTLRPDIVPFGIDDPAAGFATPARVLLGPYDAFRTVASGATRSGIPIKELVYWIPRGGTTWLVLYAAPSRLFDNHLPVFEQSIRTFSFLPSDRSGAHQH